MKGLSNLAYHDINKGAILKRHILLLSLTTFLFAKDIASTTDNIRAFVLPKDAITVHGNFTQANSGLDVLNLNEKPASSDIYSAIGNSAGLDLGIAYGLHKHISLYYDFEALNINYAGEKLKNRKNELFARINFYDNPRNSFDDFSMDIGYIHNSSKELNPQLSDLSDNAYYFRLLLGSRFNASLLNLYTGFKYTSIDTTLFKKDISRNEKALTLGISHTMEFSKYVIDSKYEYIRLFDRDGGLSENKSNQIFNINLARIINENLLVFIGTTLMTNQYNGIIPYLYNTQTQSAFDKKYNYLKLGFVYNFNTCIPVNIR